MISLISGAFSNFLLLLRPALGVYGFVRKMLLARPLYETLPWLRSRSFPGLCPVNPFTNRALPGFLLEGMWGYLPVPEQPVWAQLVCGNSATGGGVKVFVYPSAVDVRFEASACVLGLAVVCNLWSVGAECDPVSLQDGPRGLSEEGAAPARFFVNGWPVLFPDNPKYVSTLGDGLLVPELQRCAPESFKRKLALLLTKPHDERWGSGMDHRDYTEVEVYFRLLRLIQLGGWRKVTVRIRYALDELAEGPSGIYSQHINLTQYVADRHHMDLYYLQAEELRRLRVAANLEPELVVD